VIVGNGAASLTVVPLPPVISGTITVQADAVSAKAFTIAFDYQLGAGGPWVPLACSPVPLGTLYGCPFDTTTVADGALTVRATMVETDPGGATYTATASSTVGNVVVAGYDVQTSNGSSTGKPKKDDVITFTYSTTIDPATILGGWDGTRRSVYVRVSDLSAAGLGAADDDTIDVSANSNFPAVGTTSTSVALGSVDLHSDFVKSGKVVTFKAKMTALTGGSRTVVTITLGDRDEGSSSDLRTSSAKVAMTWTPSSSVTDMSGNACSPSPVDERGALDIDF
jgi:hypothetical protein